MEDKKKPGRPKTGLPTKEKLNITLSKEAKQALAVVSAYKQVSISEIIENYAFKEYKKVQKQIATTTKKSQDR